MEISPSFFADITIGDKRKTGRKRIERKKGMAYEHFSICTAIWLGST